MNVDLASTLWYFSIESSKLNEGEKMLESEKKNGGYRGKCINGILLPKLF